MKIAWIGAGKMGLPVCHRLKSAGHDVRVLARRAEQGEALRKAGFTVSFDVPTLIADADVVFTCVSDDKALADVILNETFKAAFPPTATLIDMSTVSPAVSAEVAVQLGAGTSYLRSPVSGSTAMAEAGTLTSLVSGPREAFDAMAGIFAVFTKATFYLGAAEQARFLKLAINSIVAATSVLLGEALALGRKGGLDDATMLDVITQSAVASPLIGYKKAMIVSGNYAPAATLNMLRKDVDLFLAAGEQAGLALPAGELVRAAYDEAAADGLGEQDFFVLVREAGEARG